MQCEQGTRHMHLVYMACCISVRPQNGDFWHVFRIESPLAPTGSALKTVWYVWTLGLVELTAKRNYHVSRVLRHTVPWK